MIKTVATNRLYRGPRPCTRQDLNILKEVFGVRLIINLESGAYEEFHEDVYERMMIESWELETKRIYCSNITPPKPKQVELFLKYCKTHNDVYVHCLRGKDRTGFMVAVYRMQVMKWSYEKAVQEMKAEGFNMLFYWWWLKELKKYAA